MISKILFSKFRKIIPCIGAIRNISTSEIRRGGHLQYSINSKMSKSIMNRFLALPFPEMRNLITYIWIDGTGAHIRSLDRVLVYFVNELADFEEVFIDGTACYLTSESAKADVIGRPARMYHCPFRVSSHNSMVLCEVYNLDGTPHPTNQRICLKEAIDCVKDEQVVFGLEQKFTFFDLNLRPFGWPPAVGYHARQGAFYSAVGSDRVGARIIIESVAKAALFAGLDFGGGHAGKFLSQWELQVGPAEELHPADDIWLLRYLLLRIAEDHGLTVSFSPRPVRGHEWSSSAMKCQFSTRCMRLPNGLSEIEKAIGKLQKNHLRHMQVYDPLGGDENKRRLGEKYYQFTHGVGKHDVSIKIPHKVNNAKMGYLEDRRPSSNGDPYAICNAIVRTCLLDE